MPASDLAPLARADVLAALATGMFPEEFWDCQDDACDCTYQRILMWTNPYIGETLEVRACCIWKELYQLFPQHVRVTPAFLDGNKNEWVPEPREWDADFPMPKAIWYRHLARKEGRPVGEIRKEYSLKDEERPQGTPREPMLPTLNFTQRMAMRIAMAEYAQAQERVATIMQECGLDPGLTYDIKEDGTVTLA